MLAVLGKMEDKSIIGEYLSEAEQLLESLLFELDLLAAIARDQNASQPRPAGSLPDLWEVLNGIFRTVHSIKGLSGMMGLSSVQSLAHQFENVLDDLRLGKIEFDERLAEMLREAGESLAAIVGTAARQSASDEDFAALARLLDNLANLPRAARKKPRNVESLDFSDADLQSLTDLEKHRISENLNAGRQLFEVYVGFSLGDLESGFRSLSLKLEKKGEMIGSLPAPPGPTDRVIFKLLYATGLKSSEVEALVKPFHGRVSKKGSRSLRRMAEAAFKKGGRLAMSGLPRAVQGKPGPAERKSGARPTMQSGAPDAGGDADIQSNSAPDRFAVGQMPAATQEFLQPLSQSVRIDLTDIDEISGIAHELSIEAQNLSTLARRAIEPDRLGARDRFALKQSSRKLERRFLELEERLVEMRMVSLAQTFNRAARLTERLARELGKSVSVELSGRTIQLDKMIVDRLSGPIYHVLRNAVAHGIESAAERRAAGKPEAGRIMIGATLEAGRAIISIRDDGRGIDTDAVLARARAIGAVSVEDDPGAEEVLRLISRPGFSTASEVSEVAGRGVGLDAVERAIHEMSGEMRIASQLGEGSSFELAVPTTLVMISAFLVQVCQRKYAVSVRQIHELIYLAPADIKGPDGKRRAVWRGAEIPLIELRFLLGLGGARLLSRWSPVAETEQALGHNGSGLREAGDPAVAVLRVKHARQDRVPAFITRVAGRTVAIAVERFDGQREIIVKSLGPMGRNIKGAVGAVDIEGGDVALVLDMPNLLRLRSMRF